MLPHYLWRAAFQKQSVICFFAFQMCGQLAWGVEPPIELPKESPVIVVIGEGTGIPPGTKIRGRVTRYDAEGLGFRIKNGKRYYVKWSHIRSVNGARITVDDSGMEGEYLDPHQQQQPERSPAIGNTPIEIENSIKFKMPQQTKWRPDINPHQQPTGTPPPIQTYNETSGKIQSPSPKRGKLFFTLDLFLPGNAGDGLKNDMQHYARDLPGLGVSSRWEIRTNSTIGGRGGYLFALTDNIHLGPSIGYVSGPNLDATFSASNGAVSENITQKTTTSFLRALAEGQLAFPINGNIYINLGGGLGGTIGSRKDEQTCAGTACQASSATDSTSISGFTWEIGTGVSYKKFIIGYRYARFPLRLTNADPAKREWMTSGIYTGLTF